MLTGRLHCYKSVCTRAVTVIRQCKVQSDIDYKKNLIRFHTTGPKDDKVDEILKNRPHTSRFKILVGGMFWWQKGIAVVVGLLGAVGYVSYCIRVYNIRQLKNKMASTSGQSYGEMAVGGPFELINTKNEPVTSESLEGNWLLLYFGFTYCPDICPEQMEMLGDLVDIAEQEHGITNLIPIMVTIDPDRDSPEVLDEYLADYHPRIVGLTGNDDQLNQVCRAYRVYKSKGQAVDDASDYILDHSVTQYLINPMGKAVGYFMSNRNLEERVPIFLEHIEKYNDHVNKQNTEQSWFDFSLNGLKKVLSV